MFVAAAQTSDHRCNIRFATLPGIEQIRSSKLYVQKSL